MNLQVRVFQVHRHPEPFTTNRVEDSSTNIEIQGVAKLIDFSCAAGLDSCRHVARVMPAEAGFPKRSQQILERLVAEKVQGLVGKFKTNLPPILPFPTFARNRFLPLPDLDISFVGEPFDQVLDES